jgi:2-keto-myo-inositol isomerase
MRLALNGATIMPSPLEDDVRIAADAGFDALEMWAQKLPAYLEHHTLEELRDDLAARGLQPWTINSIERITFGGPDRDREAHMECERLSDVARAIGAPAIVVVPGPLPEGASLGDVRRATIESLRTLSDIAGEIALAFEFLGPPWCSVRTLGAALDIVDAVDRPNVGLVVDTFHFYAGGSAIGDIARVPIEKLLVVHINDAEPLPREQLSDAHRLYPGEGAIPLADIFGALRAAGFDGTVSVEIFRPEYWERAPEDVARTAREKALAVLQGAGLCSV